jgi:hypothetical protein
VTSYLPEGGPGTENFRERQGDLHVSCPRSRSW